MHAQVYSSHDDSELTKVVLARRSDIAYSGPLQPLELLQTLQVQPLIPFLQSSYSHHLFGMPHKCSARGEHCENGLPGFGSDYWI